MPLRRKRLTPAERLRKLVDSARTSRNRDLPTMLRLSSAAVALAEEKIAELPNDLVIAAWTQFGNAHRIAGRYEVAQQALNRAAELPTSDTATKVALLEVTANLHRDTGRYESAVHLLTSAIADQKLLGDSTGEARSMHLLGLTYLDSGEPERALCAFQTALGLLGDAPLDVVASTGHSLFRALIQAGRLSAAAAALEVLEPFYRRLASARLAARCAWVRARLWRNLLAVHRRPACLRTSLYKFPYRFAIPRALATEAQATVPPLPFGVGSGARTGQGASRGRFRASPLSRRRTAGRSERRPGRAAYAVLRPRSCSSRSSRLSVSL